MIGFVVNVSGDMGARGTERENSAEAEVLRVVRNIAALLTQPGMRVRSDLLREGKVEISLEYKCFCVVKVIPVGS
jgi:hypothetical protein